MSKYFALPVIAVVLSLVGFRWLALPAGPVEEAPAIVVSLPAAQEPAAAPEPAPIVTPAELWEAPAPVPVPAPRVEAPVTVPAPVPIEPPAPIVRTEVIERTVYVPQPTVVYAPTTVVQTVTVPAPEPKQETIENPPLVIIAPPAERPISPPRRPRVKQDDGFFKSIPFQPPTPRGPRWNP